jgi:MtN3 and saliva related transmembrane protein
VSFTTELVNPAIATAVNFESPWVQDLGFAAAFCTTAAFVPQLMRVLRLRSAREISVPTFLLFSIGVILWLLYGVYTGSKPVIASNGITLVLSVSILVLKLRYDRRGLEEFEP